VRNALLTHRATYVGQVLNRDNIFYVPPELLLDGDRGAVEKQGEWMCQQIVRVLAAERTRDVALAALQRSEAEQRELAEQLAEANRDLERRVADRTAQLQFANQNLEAFSYSVSHDLRAPLRAIVGFGEILEEDAGDRLDEESRKSLHQIRASARQMQELIDGMLEMARVAKVVLRRVDVDLTALAEMVVRQLRSGDPARSVEVVLTQGLRVHVDPILLQSVMTNLLGNAWKFTAKRAQARIEVGQCGEERGMPVFVVSDNGAGFDMRYAQKLFGVFQRLHRQDEFPGTGVGLATVERIILRHGGRIWAEGRPNEGARFFFTLPRAHGADRPAPPDADGDARASG
jgi:light-regulated signal transduction histidine kinase (bacteriophytochrome)